MRWLLAVVMAALPALGAEIVFEQSPSLVGTFHVFVRGVAETVGEVTVVNLRTSELVRVPLVPVEGGLRGGPVHAPRECDVPLSFFLVVRVGDMVVAATTLGGGLSATAWVGPRLPRPGEPKLTLEWWDDVEMKWVPAKEAGPARLRIVLEYATADVTCDPDVVSLPVEVGAQTFALALAEDAATSGRFNVEFVTVVEPQRCDLVLRVLSLVRDVLFEAPVPAGLSFRFEGQRLFTPLHTFRVTLVPSVLVLPVGCLGEVRVVEPARADEVRWCVDGLEQPVRGPVLTLFADAPRALRVVALVRSGLRWARAESTVTYTPQAQVSFVDAVTGRPVLGLWPCTHFVRVRVENVTIGARITVGKLGPDPRAKELVLVEMAPDGAFLSEPIRPSDFGACAGDVLWAQYRDPRGCYTAFATLPLR